MQTQNQTDRSGIMALRRFIGRIKNVDGNFGFIELASVTTEDGSPHDIDTGKDIFIHQDECSDPLKTGMQIVFDVMPDRKRGGDAFRAVAAFKFIETALLPTNEAPIPGFAFVMPVKRNREELALSIRSSAHEKMKPVPVETVRQVVANEPMPHIPRGAELPENAKEEAMKWLLAQLFPTMVTLGSDFAIHGESDEEFDDRMNELVTTYKEMGITAQIDLINNEIGRFREARKTLSFIYDEGLVRRDAIIPLQYLPDLFMAVPVWYSWVSQDSKESIQAAWKESDPQPSSSVIFFCDLFPNQRWADTFQLFNRRFRTLYQYKGEIIPLHVTRRMKRAMDFFDFVVIATPYHDQAGKDWEDIDWLRAIDPYVLGFKEGIPFFFVLARFSDTGTFPLFNELVADTIAFLKTRKQKLAGFNNIDKPFWFNYTFGKAHGDNPFGNYLIKHVDQLLAAFEKGILFDWLRGEDEQAAIAKL